MHYEGDETDFIIYATSARAVEEYLEDPEDGSLVATVDVFKVYTTSTPDQLLNDQFYHEASNIALHNEFGSHNLDDILRQILLKAKIIE